jgi:hypothetical protein
MKKKKNSYERYKDKCNNRSLNEEYQDVVETQQREE